MVLISPKENISVLLMPMILSIPIFIKNYTKEPFRPTQKLQQPLHPRNGPIKQKKWAGIPGVYHHFSDKLTAVRNGSCWNKIYLTQFLRQNNLKFPAGLISEDNFFVIKSLAICQKLAVINNTYYHYIMNPSSLTHDPKIEGKRKNDNLIISCMILEFIKQNIPQARKQVIHFILKNIIAYRYLADNAYYLKLRKAAGFSFTLLKARLFALYDARKKKI